MRLPVMVERLLIFAALVGVAILALLPLAVMIRVALLSPDAAYRVPLEWFAVPTWEHFVHVLTRTGFPRYLLNSLILSVGATAVVLVVGTLAAFALAKHRGTSSHNLLFFVLSTRMGPPMVFAVPVYVLMVQLRMIDSHVGMLLIDTFMNLAFAIWMMYGFFRDLPPEIEEAGLLDGLSTLGVFLRVSLPVVAVGLAATATLVFIMTWNEFFYAMVLTRETAKTFPAQVPGFFGAFRINWGGMFAASTSGILLPLTFGILVRRYLARGLTMGAVR